MINNIWIIYDDSCKPKYDIQNVIGDKTFGEVIHKRKTLKERYFYYIDELNHFDSIQVIENIYSIQKVHKTLEEVPEELKIIHLFSDHVVKNKEDFLVVMGKCTYIQENVYLCTDGIIAGIIFKNVKEYRKYLTLCFNIKDSRQAAQSLEAERLNSNSFFYLNLLSNFLKFITGGFEARYFNSLNGDEYTVTKSSENKNKIKSEYKFYYFLPDEMKQWFVQPYNYFETNNYASYTMERLNMTDIAIRWVHSAITINEFEQMLHKIFYFLNIRKRREINKEQYFNQIQKLYINKVEERIKLLKNYDEFKLYDNYISYSTKYQSIDELVDEYKFILKSILETTKVSYIEVIGHGDLCFSNMLYNKDTMTLKLIDTKGALNEEDIWTNPYYDLAKLSHSICGRYDFFNNGMYEIKLNESMKFELELEFDNSNYKKIFKKFLMDNEFDYKLTRIYEVSLFLSMLPLHIDNTKKVFGFLLNAINILEEIKNE